MPAPKILPAAYEDILNIADYRMREVGPNSAEEITNRLLDTIDLLEEIPLIGPLHHDPALQSMGYRKLLCGQYVCIYRIVDGTPFVYRVFHESQNYTVDFLWEM